MTGPLTVFGISSCDTVKRARAWLAEQGVEHRFHDFKRDGVPELVLDHWLATCGWEALLNKRGTTWRTLDAPTQATVVDRPSARRLMLASPSVIKRPVVDWPDGSTTVGFDAPSWASRKKAP
jgi:arsenate reductase (glutaredoxin)